MSFKVKFNIPYALQYMYFCIFKEKQELKCTKASIKSNAKFKRQFPNSIALYLYSELCSKLMDKNIKLVC